MSKTWIDWMVRCPRETINVILVGCIQARLTAKEVNEWERHILAIPGVLDLWTRSVGLECAARNATDPEIATTMIGESDRIQRLALGPHAEAWLVGCMERRKAEDAEYRSEMERSR